MTFCIFYITCPDESTAHEIGQHLLQLRLAACYNTFPITSGYWWQGMIQRDQEWVCVAKTSEQQASALEQAVLGIHPYEVPCVVHWSAAANEAYARWIEEETVGQPQAD